MAGRTLACTVAGEPILLRERAGAKAIRIRLGDDGLVRVSAPFGVRRERIGRALHDAAAFLGRERAEQARAPRLPVPLADGCQLPFWGQTLVLERTTGSKKGPELVGDRIRVCAKNGQASTDLQLRRQLLRFYGDALLARVAERRQSEKDFPRDVAIDVRLYRSRWGSCRPDERRITLCARLALLEPVFADYVLDHELAHLVVPNHSAGFYRELERRQPDWRHLRQALQAQRYASFALPESGS